MCICCQVQAVVRRMWELQGVVCSRHAKPSFQGMKRCLEMRQVHRKSSFQEICTFQNYVVGAEAEGVGIIQGFMFVIVLHGHCVKQWRLNHADGFVDNSSFTVY